MLETVADDRETLVLVAIDTLFSFAPEQSVLEKLQANRSNWPSGFMKKVFAEKIESYREYLENDREPPGTIPEEGG